MIIAILSTGRSASFTATLDEKIRFTFEVSYVLDYNDPCVSLTSPTPQIKWAIMNPGEALPTSQATRRFETTSFSGTEGVAERRGEASTPPMVRDTNIKLDWLPCLPTAGSSKPEHFPTSHTISTHDKFRFQIGRRCKGSSRSVNCAIPKRR